MPRHRLLLLVIGLGLLLSSPLLCAHHAEAAEYDATKPVKVSGMLTKVEWQNPHVWFYVEVKEQDGKLTTWGFSTAPPGALMRRGVSKTALKIGSVINVEGVRARDGSNNASARRITFADGTNVLTPTEGGK
jgi:hypothetical protein